MAEPLGVHRAYYLTVVEVPLRFHLSEPDALLDTDNTRERHIHVESGRPKSTVYLLPSEDGERLLQAWEEGGHRATGEEER